MALCYCEHICFLFILFFRHPVLEKLVFKGLIILGHTILFFTFKKGEWKYGSFRAWTTGKYTFISICFTYLVYLLVIFLWASLVAQTVKNPPAMQDTGVRSLGWKDPLEEGNGYSLQHSGLENSINRETWQTIHGVCKELDMTEWLSLSRSIFLWLRMTT